MLKGSKKIILSLGVVILIIMICWVAIYSYKSHKSPSSTKGSETKKPPSKPTPPSIKPPIDKNIPPVVFPINDIPTEREDINLKLTLEQKKRSQKLTSEEEKKIIENLSCQIGIDKNKSFFNYDYGFSMAPGIQEVFGDGDWALYLFTDKGKFFVKINNYSDLSRFEYEKESMLAINEAVPDFAPHPLCLGNLPKGGKFLVVNFLGARWHDRLIIENQKLLAKSLAQLHQKKSPNGKFGFHSGKNNQWKESWEIFFQENRWQPLWKRVREKYPHDEKLKKWGEIIGTKVIPDLLGNLQIEPVLLHGNLDFDSWDINSQTNQPWVFDTHSYYGHNEMDLSLVHYFCPPGKIPNSAGEFSEPEFLAEYQKHYLPSRGFEERKNLYRLYDYLHRRFTWRKLIPGTKFYEKCLTMMKKLGQKYS